MQTKPWMKVAATTGLALLLLSMLLLNACGGADTTEPVEEKTTTTTTTTVVEVSEFEVVKDAAAEYLKARAGNTKAADLFMAIAEDDAPYIVSLRSAADYTKGHIPGAVNIAFGDLTTLPEDEEILVYCYTGQTASFAAALLGVLDYDVQNLLHGMSSWSTDPDVFVSRFSTAAQSDFKVETTANTATKTHDFPEMDNTTSDDEDTILEAAVATVSPKYITASDLNIKIAEDEDMTIISVRSAADYAAGHVPGAINIGIDSLVDNLDKIDPDSPVYVYCYTGHTAAQAASLLNLLGYDAYSLKFGMCSWTTDTAVNMNKCFDASGVQGYDTE
ncbi:MAG TPA: rhodanese-like domain-containing protein [Dehalococcoidales bacterium]|nr:rhodanese-like domain-containing protein [Dehalococcoidales bacterium]